LSYSAFSIRRVSKKKWKLFQGDAQLGEFGSYDEAKEAMDLVITPDIHYFDAQGNEVEAS
jgi:hypothetical protein